MERSSRVLWLSSRPQSSLHLLYCCFRGCWSRRPDCFRLQSRCGYHLILVRLQMPSQCRGSETLRYLFLLFWRRENGTYWRRSTLLYLASWGPKKPKIWVRSSFLLYRWIQRWIVWFWWKSMCVQSYPIGIFFIAFVHSRDLTGDDFLLAIIWWFPHSCEMLLNLSIPQIHARHAINQIYNLWQYQHSTINLLKNKINGPDEFYICWMRYLKHL